MHDLRDEYSRVSDAERMTRMVSTAHDTQTKGTSSFDDHYHLKAQPTTINSDKAMDTGMSNSVEQRSPRHGLRAGSGVPRSSIWPVVLFLIIQNSNY